MCCVCVFSSHSLWTSSLLDVPAGVTQEEGHTEFLIHLLSAVRASICFARRIQPFLSLVDCEVGICVLILHPLGIFSSKVGRACLVSWSYGLYFLFVRWSALTCLFCLNLLFLGTCYQVHHIFSHMLGFSLGLLFVYFCTLFWISLWTRKFVSLP